MTNGRIFVKADKDKFANFRRTPSRKPMNDDKRTVVIIGSGPSGLTAAETLRQEGFGGRVILVGKEKHLPYDRPKLSKTMNSTADKILLRNEKFFEDFKIELKLGVQVKELDAKSKTVSLASGETLKYDMALIATGGE